MRRFSILLSCALAVGPATARGNAIQQVGCSDRDIKVDANCLPPVYMPYTPGQKVPCGWKCITVKVPVTETCMKTVCEKQTIQVAKEVPCTVCKKIQIPTEVYKTYVRFKAVRVEDGFVVRASEAPQAELDDLEAEREQLRQEVERLRELKREQREKELDSKPLDAPEPEDRSASLDSRDENPMIAASATLGSGPHPAAADEIVPEGYERVPVTKIRKKCTKIHVPVTKTVEVDEGCWKEVPVPCPCTCGKVPCCEVGCGCRILDCESAKPQTRRVWVPCIVERQVTVMEARDVMVDECYTDYILRKLPDAAPDAAPDTAPDTQPDIAPVVEDVMVTEDRTVLIPQYVTKAERHFVTRTIRVASTRTVFVPVTQTVRREVPYEVRRIETRQVLVPVEATISVPVIQPQVMPRPQTLPPGVTVPSHPLPQPLPAPKSADDKDKMPTEAPKLNPPSK